MGIHAIFVDPVEDELQCPICHLVMAKPVSHCSQGHTFCQTCIQAWLNHPPPLKAGPPSSKTTKKASHCPGCMLPLGPKVRNIVAEAMVAKLRVRCSNSKRRENEQEAMRKGGEGKEEGRERGREGEGEGLACEWVGRLEELERHRRADCAYEVIACPYHHHQKQQQQAPREKGVEQGEESEKDESSDSNSNSNSSSTRKDNKPQTSKAKKNSFTSSTTITASSCSSSETGCSYRAWRSRIEKEHISQCPHRPTSCSLACGWTGKKMEEARHQGTSCPRVILFCQNKGCPVSFARAGSDAHYDTECPFQPVPCVFAPHGCLVRPLRQAQAQHQADAAVEHASLTANKISSLEAGIEKMCGQFEDLRQRVEHSEKATRETIVSLVANPHPGVYLILYSRIRRQWNQGGGIGLLGGMGGGREGADDRLSQAIDLFLEGVVSDGIPSSPAASATPFLPRLEGGGKGREEEGVEDGLRNMAAAAAAAAAALAGKVEEGREEGREGGKEGGGDGGRDIGPALDAIKFFERLQQGGAGTGLFQTVNGGVRGGGVRGRGERGGRRGGGEEGREDKRVRGSGRRAGHRQQNSEGEGTYIEEVEG